MISYPSSVPVRQVRNQAITAADFYPTLLELCDIPLPDVKLDGKSLLPILDSPQAPSHHDVMHWQWQKNWAVRRGDWKLIATGDKLFLGNLAEKEPERTDHSEDQPELVAELKALHEAWLKEVQPTQER